MVQLYCVKCRAKREVKEYEEVKTKNGRHAIKAKCPVCHTSMFKFVKNLTKGSGSSFSSFGSPTGRDVPQQPTTPRPPPPTTPHPSERRTRPPPPTHPYLYEMKIRNTPSSIPQPSEKKTRN